jgi:hypothetical protein
MTQRHQYNIAYNEYIYNIVLYSLFSYKELVILGAQLIK